MIRDELGDFGRGMPEDAFGAALAALLTGMDTSRAERISPRGRVTIPRPLWFWAGRLTAGETDADRWRDTWRDAAMVAMSQRKGARYGLAVELVRDVWPWTGRIDLTELARAIGAGELVSAVHFTTAPRRSPAEWLWPLDVALFDDPASERLGNAIPDLHFARFVTRVRAESATAPIELLVIPRALREALAMVLAHDGLPRVQAVLVLGGHATTTTPIEAAETLRASANADAVCIASVPSGSEAALLDQMLEELSHDVDLDVAFTQACRREKVGAPILIGAQGAFARAHLARWGHHVASSLSRRLAAPVAPLNYVAARRSDEAARELAGRLPSFLFDHENDEATDVATLGRMARAASPEVAARERRVQAELFDGQAADANKVVEAPLARGRTYRLDVWVGPLLSDSLIAPVAFPDDELPGAEEEKGHTLTVVLTAPGYLETPAVQTLHLPTQGESTRARFDLPIGQDTKRSRLVARMTLLHENRVLQTVLLDAPVGEGELVPLALTLETVLRRDLNDAVGRRRFDAALLFNDLAGASSMSVFVDERASLVMIDGISETVEAVGKILEDATNQPDRYGPPPAKATTRLLADLARRGSLLRRALFEMPRVRDDLAGARRIQIIAAKPEAVLPIEACYDPLPPADDAVMCPNWETALASAKSSCSATCPQDMRSIVCPIGFWATNRVIERHVYRKPDAGKLGAESFALQSEPTTSRHRLPVCDGGVCAAADAARAVNPDDVDQAFSVASNEAKPAPEVKSWAAWKQEIAARNPALLLLLAHTDSKSDLSTLVIGNDAALLTDLDERFVGRGAGPGPLVLLLGCSTAVQKPVYESFVTEFRRGGAAVVVGTLCEILGQHAAPIAKGLVEQFARANKAPDGMPLGECMTAVRRRLLAAGFPIVLTVIAFGDADWLI